MVGIFTVKVDSDEPVQEVDERDEHERMLDELLDDILGSDDEDVGDEVTERPQLRRQDAQLRLGDELDNGLQGQELGGGGVKKRGGGSQSPQG